MRLLIISLLFLVSTAHAVKCKNHMKVVYGDRERVKIYQAVSARLDIDETTYDCPSCLKTYSWFRNEKDSFVLLFMGCRSEEGDDGCNKLENHRDDIFEDLVVDTHVCVCNKDMCNEESGDQGDEWRRIFGSKVEKGKVGDENPDKLKCYSHFKILDKSQKLDEELKKLDHIDPRELQCRGVKQCMVNLININDLKSIIMGCADVKGKSDGCIIADDKMNATCYCSSNLCFSPEAAEGMMDEFARTGKVNHPPQGGNTNTGNPMPGGSLGAGGAGVYSNGSPNIFTSFFLFFFVALVILIL